jgi:protein-S-isoprenylcysteine O-methyltransferase Ste14
MSAPPGGTSTIRRGPYRFIRHPMHAAALLFVWASVLGHVSVLTLAIGLAITVVVLIRVVVAERLLPTTDADSGNCALATKALVPYLF